MISVIVPVYNCEKYIERLLNSLLNQSYKKLEIILVNDGSVDSSEDIIKKYAKKNSNIILITQENQGVSAARNKGLAIAKGEYISFVDADDYLSFNYYDELINVAQNFNADIVLSPFIFDYDGDHENARKFIPKEGNSKEITLYAIENDKFNLEYCMIWNKIFHRRVITNTMQFPVGLVFEELPFNFQAYENSKIIKVAKNTMYYYHQSPTGLSGIAQTQNTKSVFNKNKDMIKISKILLDIFKDKNYDLYCFAYKIFLEVSIGLFQDEYYQFLNQDIDFKKYLKSNLKYFSKEKEFKSLLNFNTRCLIKICLISDKTYRLLIKLVNIK